MANGRTSHNGSESERETLRQIRAARIRAARAYADLGQADLATALGVSVITVKRMERGSRDISLEELHTLADLCDFPRWWMEDGFQEGDSAGESPEERHALFTVMHELGHLRMALADVWESQVDARTISREAIDRLRRPSSGDDEDLPEASGA